MAVCPIVGGQAIKGPTAKLMSELGAAANPHSIARHYGGLIDGLLIDGCDQAWTHELALAGVRCACADIVMRSAADRIAVARAALDLADQIGRPAPARASS